MLEYLYLYKMIVIRLLLTAEIPRGVFCEWSEAEVTENPGWKFELLRKMILVSVNNVSDIWRM